jgi:uncharacterized protein YvpB
MDTQPLKILSQPSLPLSRRHFWRGVFGFLLGLALFSALAVAAVFILFTITRATAAQHPAAAQPGAAGGIPDTGLLTPSPTRSVTPRSAPSLTPFLPVTNTPRPTHTPTPTQTPTFTPSPTQTETPTDIPTDTAVPPTETPSDGLPEAATVRGVYGAEQSLPLSCEARSAVDWARFFGVDIGEMDFQYALPISDNPNTGFVGDPRSGRGQIPPNPYGVHAAPVAALLRANGLNAQGYSGLGLVDLRREIADGQPVIVWVIGNVWNGSGVSYTASDGETLTVAPFEHTVILTAYTQNTVTVIDGALMYSTTTERFLASWGVLGNMAVIIE